MKKQIDYNKLLTGGAIIFGSLLVYKTFQKFGIIPTSTDIQIEKLTSEPGSYWKPQYYKKFNTVLNKRVIVENYAKLIYQSFTLFDDDFNQIMSVFNKLKNKCQVSQLADVFSDIYKKDLLNFLLNGGGLMPWDGLSDTEMKKLIAYTDKLPNK